ncbi:unnamed protein product [Miscanthus lutarioriparius]|uniref:Disease resistance R13L4/SHOC-2-like LRR domain-containing protein n=1 Tax=Miscanthus lutarioriparius TaxID=422564 RepID=A0A811QFE5_9POAL|nr:unnamed protein product [Miscanthus lutarioriparius]
MPRGIKNLTGLHALQNVKATSETLCDVAALTELRTFSVDDVTSEHSLILRNALLKMRNLVSLSITSMSDTNEVLPPEELCLPESLCKLGLTGKLKKKRMPHILSSWLHLNNLTQLYLMSSKLDENSFPTLMVLRSLCLITLDKAYDGQTLCFPSQSFSRLKELRVYCAPRLNRVEIEEDALGSLAKLWFVECPELKRLPHGLKYLTMLDELHLVNTAVELIQLANECEEELMKISHIKKFTIISNDEKNFRRRIVSNEENEFAG